MFSELGEGGGGAGSEVSTQTEKMRGFAEVSFTCGTWSTVQACLGQKPSERKDALWAK